MIKSSFSLSISVSSSEFEFDFDLVTGGLEFKDFIFFQVAEAVPSLSPFLGTI